MSFALAVSWLAGFGIFVAVSYYLGRAILRPLVEREAPGAHVQFRITDIYVLIAQLFLVGAIMVGLDTRGENASGEGQLERLEILIPAWLVVAWWWWLGVRRLSRAGIRDGRRRAAILGIAVPFAFGNYFLLLLLIPLTMRIGGQVEHNGLFSFFFLAILLLSLYMVFSGCRRMAEWAVATAGDPP